MEETRSNSFLEKQSLGKLMCKYAVPNVISLLVAALYNIVDQIFIANADYLGSYGNAANTVVYPLTVVALSIAAMFGDGCCAFVSISLGAKKNNDARRSIGSTIISVVTCSLILTAIYLVFQNQIIALFGGTVNDETFALSKDYFFWITLGIPFYMFGQAMNPIIRSDGAPGYSMFTLLIGAGINIVLDPILIYVCGWGMKGAAIATILGQIVSAICAFAYLFRMKAVKLDRDSFKFRGALMKKVSSLGATSFLSYISIVLSMLAVVNMVTKYGAMDEVFGQEEYSHIPTAMVGIVMKFFQIVISISIGISSGCIPIVGYNIGAGRNDRVKKLMKLMVATQAAVGLVFSVVFLSFPTQLLKIFGSESESIYYTQFGVICIRVFLGLSVLACVNKGSFIFLQSMGKTKESSFLAMLREIAFGVGLPIVLPIFFGLYGILFFMPLADILTLIPTVILLVRASRQLDSSTVTAKAKSSDDSGSISAQTSNALTGMIITIGRSYGAGGRSVGKLVAEQLSIPYYDSSLLEKAAQANGLSQSFMEDMDEKSVKIYSYNPYSVNGGSTISETAAKAQREVIEKLAEEGACVIIGRRADRILKDLPNVFSVFVCASEEYRAQRIVSRDNVPKRDAAKKVKDADSERASYYNLLSDDNWGEASTYDLCVHTDKLGIDGAASTIVSAVKLAESVATDKRAHAVKA